MVAQCNYIGAPPPKQDRTGKPAIGLKTGVSRIKERIKSNLEHRKFRQ
jgi:hypothetical protein